MNLKPSLKYSNGNFLKDAIIFYSMFIFSFLAFGIIKNVFGGEMYGGGFDLIYAIFIFISCYNSLKNNIPMFLQNSLSRKTLYISSFIQLIVFSIFASIFNCLIIDDKLSKFAFNSYKNFFSEVYYTDPTVTNNVFLNIGFLFALILFFGSLAYFLSILLYRLSKTLKVILLSCSISLIFILPPLDVFFDGKIRNLLISIYSSFMGIPYPNSLWNLSQPNPAIGVISLLICATIFSGLTFLLIRKVNIKNK